MPRLVWLLNNITHIDRSFSVFKQHYTHFYTLFHPHVFQKIINNITQTPLPIEPLVFFFFATFFFEINSFYTYKTFNLTTWPISIYSLIYLTIVDFTWVSHMYICHTPQVFTCIKFASIYIYIYMSLLTPTPM